MGLLAVISLPTFDIFLHAHTWPIYVVIFLTGLCRGFLSPAQFGLMGQIVPPELYGKASAWNSNVWQIACITGPPLEGWLYGAEVGAMTLMRWRRVLLACGLVSKVCWRFHSAARVSAPFGRSQTIWASISEGLSFVFRSQILLKRCRSGILFAVLLAGAVALLLIYAVSKSFTVWI